MARYLSIKKFRLPLQTVLWESRKQVVKTRANYRSDALSPFRGPANSVIVETMFLLLFCKNASVLSSPSLSCLAPRSASRAINLTEMHSISKLLFIFHSLFTIFLPRFSVAILSTAVLTLGQFLPVSLSITAENGLSVRLTRDGEGGSLSVESLASNIRFWKTSAKFEFCIL